MRFLSAAPRLKMVVRASYKEQVGPNVVPHRGLTARFLNHSFDSERSQRDLGWTDEERRQVEAYLLGHEWFDRARGIYLEELKPGEQSEEVQAVLSRKVGAPATVGKARCIAFFRNEENEPEQCPNEALEGTDLCAQHSESEVAEEAS